VQWLLPVGGGWSWEVSQGLHYIGAHFLKLHFSDPVQVASIHDWLTPRNEPGPVLCGIHQILPVFHPRLLTCGQAPTPAHTEKGEAWRWTEDEQKAFKELK